MFERQGLGEIFLFLLPGVWTTLKLAFLSAAAGLGAGTLLGCAYAWGGALLRTPLFLLLTLARGIPLLVQVFVAFFGLPAMGIELSAMACASVALIFFTSLSTMEIVRGGIAGVPTEQFVAARSLGYSFVQTVTGVVLPQTVRIVMPSLVNQLVLVIKATAVVSFIGVADVMLLAKESTERTQMGFATMGMVWLIYTALCLPIAWGGRRIEATLNSRGFAAPGGA